MEVIVSHIGTDFDGLAAMVACSKLYPGARMVLVGSQRPAVRQFIALHREALSLYRPNQLNLEHISQLYIVDAPGCQRLGDAAWLCDKAEKVIVYDHHPPFTQEGLGIRERLGSATTILVELLRENKLPVSPFEATLYLLGIYEDTRCLTNLSTTVRDLVAAAWLLEKGANLAEVGKYINIPFNDEQRELFEDMLGEAQIELINQRNILFAEASSEQFIAGLGRLTQRLAELEECDVALSIVRMENRVHLVGRSSRPNINLVEILGPMGVRGHAGAITLTVKDSAADLRRQVRELLSQRLPPGQLAADIMSAPVKSVGDSMTIAEAHRVLLRYGHTGMPVVNKKRVVVGIISRRDVEKAMRHDLGHAPVRGYMTKNVVSIDTQATIDQVTRMIIQNDIGRLPVLDKGELVGIITRTDVLLQIHGDGTPRWHKPLFTHRDYRLAKAMPNLTELINTRLPQRIQGILLLLGQKAEKEGFKAYAVGGFVRDLILGLPNLDLDIAVEDNAIKFARMLPPLLGGKLQEHEEFGTATLTLPDGFQIDFATARMEFYQFPAASPEVEQTTIRHDLYRRDFTINTLAFAVNSPSFGGFLDFFGGHDDLQAGLIRVLYNLSFVEDPTRILRALRFAARYGFDLEEQTRELLDTAMTENVLAKTPAGRLGREFYNIFNEVNVPVLLEMAQEIGVIKSLLPDMAWTDVLEQKIAAAARIIQWNNEQNIADAEGWLLYPLLLLGELSPSRRKAAAAKLGLTGKEKLVEKVLDQAHEVSTVLKQSELAASEIYNLLEPVSVLGLLYLLASNPGQARLKSRVMLYLEKLADVEISIDGYDLKKLGLETGPELGSILKAVRRAKLDGEVHSREEELALAQRLKEKGE